MYLIISAPKAVLQQPTMTVIVTETFMQFQHKGKLMSRDLFMNHDQTRCNLFLTVRSEFDLKIIIVNYCSCIFELKTISWIIQEMSLSGPPAFKFISHNLGVVDKVNSNSPSIIALEKVVVSNSSGEGACTMPVESLFQDLDPTIYFHISGVCSLEQHLQDILHMSNTLFPWLLFWKYS